jgi:hypothetical protein
MPTITLTLDIPHAAQLYIKRNLSRFTVINCGRRFGKNILDKDMAIETMLAGYPVGWFEPTYKSLADIWREICSTLHPVTRKRSEQEKRLELITGGVMDMWSLEDPDNGRGRKYKRVIINEAAKVSKLEYAWTNVIRATLADMQGDALFTSTPKGLNYFHQLWTLAADNPDWARFRYSTYDNPHIPKSEIDSMKEELPERVFQQEIMAEFLADGTYFQNIDAACTIHQADKPDEHAGHYIVGGLDWALSNDFTVLTLACRDCNKTIYWDRFNQIDFTYQRERIKESCKRYGIAGLMPERNSIGEPNIEMLMADGVPVLRGPDGKAGFTTTATTKPQLIQKLAAALEHDGFQAPHDYADELRSYEVETMASGHPKFSAPDGMHDDRVISLALAWWAVANVQWLI